jgi:hypothetical protein
MRKMELPLALVVLLLGLFIAWCYLTTVNNVGALDARLPSEEQLNGMSPDQLGTIKPRLSSDCLRVADLAKRKDLDPEGSACPKAAHRGGKKASIPLKNGDCLGLRPRRWLIRLPFRL